MASQSISKQERGRIYYLQNREAIRARSKARYDAKRDEINAQQKQKRADDPDRFRAKDRQRYWTRPEAMRRAARAYYQRNAAKQNGATKTYHAAHPEKVREYKRRWTARHPERRRIAIRNNKDLRRGAKGRFTLDNLLAKYEFHGWRCYLCRIPITLQTSHPDHRKPLARGGTNWIANVAPACIQCNLHKNRRTESEYRALLRL